MSRTERRLLYPKYPYTHTHTHLQRRSPSSERPPVVKYASADGQCLVNAMDEGDFWLVIRGKTEFSILMSIKTNSLPQVDLEASRENYF